MIREQISKTKMEYIIKAKANFRNKSVANNVDIFIPVPNDMQAPQFKVILNSNSTTIPNMDSKNILISSPLLNFNLPI